MRPPLRTLFAIISFFLLAAHVSGQTHFYISSITVEPAAPTVNDAITIALHGDLSSSGAHIVSTSYMLMGNIVHITVTAADPGGADVLVPHTEQVAIGTLPAGPYSILVDGTFILDAAPEVEHSFNVEGGPDCSTLTIESIQWSTFSDTAIVVHVSNSNIGFSYPGFVLLDAENDTLAMETVSYFAIGQESWHTLRLHPDAQVPTGLFDAHLHLWTGFYSSLACMWELPVDLCPAQECVSFFPYIQNTGDGMALGTYSWHIANDGGEVASGQFELTNEVQMDLDEVCLPPGTYQLSTTLDQEPTGGQLSTGVSGEGLQWGPSSSISQGSPGLLSFQLLTRCAEGTNSIPSNVALESLSITTTADGLFVRNITGQRLGTVRLFDMTGALIHERSVNGDSVALRPKASGIYLIQALGVTRRSAFLLQ